MDRQLLLHVGTDGAPPVDGFATEVNANGRCLVQSEDAPICGCHDPHDSELNGNAGFYGQIRNGNRRYGIFPRSYAGRLGQFLEAVPFYEEVAQLALPL